MQVSRRWILIPLVSTCLLLIAVCLPYLTGGAAWSILLLVVLGAADCVCLLISGRKLRCPACGEPLHGLIYRYLFQKERGTCCPGCGQFVEIVK